MKTKIGLTFGLTLTLVLGVFAVMLALGLFPTTSVQAGTLSASAITVVHSPTEPGDPAKVTVKFTTVEALVGGQDTIKIEFEDDVQVPVTLDRTAITMSAVLMTSTKSGGATGGQVANPLGVTVEFVGTPADEPLVTLDIPDMDPDTQTNTGSQGIAAGTVVTIVFRQSAGILNPTEGGSYEVKIETTNDSAGSRVTSSTGQTIPRIIKLSSKDGERGKSVTITGKGFKNSTTATAWLDNADTGTRGATEPVLCSASVGSDDEFSCSFTVSVPPFTAGANTINAVDGRANITTSGNEGTWTLKGKIVAIPDQASVGDTVTIELRDFPASITVSAPTSGTSSQDGDSDLDVFTLGGVEIEGPAFSTDSSGDASFTITIPDSVELGSQSLAIDITSSGTRRDTMTILGAQVELTPTTVVPNQTLTVSGRGFTKSSSIDSNHPSDTTIATNSQILIGGTEVGTAKIDNDDTVDIDNSGNWVATVVIPVSTPATEAGTYEFKVVDGAGRPGVAQLTIAGRTVSFDPEESRVGTQLTISGGGWPANNTISGATSTTLTVSYTLAGASSATTSVSVTPDSDGNFSTTLKVPLSASIPSTNKVTVEYSDESSVTVSEVVAHRVPGADIIITPASGPGGTTVAVTGDGFKAFTTVTALSVGTASVLPAPNPTTDANGHFETEILVPALDTGSHTVKATVGSTTANAGYTVTTAAATATPAPASAETESAVVFAPIIDNNDNLVRVFRFDNATQGWSFYDPRPAFESANDLTTATGGDIVWIRVNEAQDFSGISLVGGWNLIVLP
ncbi:MAG: hypothetical protein BZY88_16605 [SAR202 cluster bacterium Io17-Chloro-G9]|nr:MAG: hypothetical protein BZY88_16605 [SAR202 cluster bacterium Io17-Chloro-G9]